MTKVRKATPVTFTREQRAQLERLWFIYGNYGSKRTPGNHSFIQGLLEHGLDLRPLFTKRTGKAEKPTLECEAAVDKVLASDRSSEDTSAERASGDRLKIVSARTPERPPEDTELKELLDDMKRRNRAMRARLEDEDNTPDAA